MDTDTIILVPFCREICHAVKFFTKQDYPYHFHRDEGLLHSHALRKTVP